MHELERLYHIHCAKGEVGRYVILPGDPGRCPSIAALFDDAHLVARNREYTTRAGPPAYRAASRPYQKEPLYSSYSSSFLILLPYYNLLHAQSATPFLLISLRLPPCAPSSPLI